MVATKLLRALVKKAKKAPKKKPDPKKFPKKPKPTFESEVRNLKGKAMSDAARQAEAKRIAKKYNKSVRAVLKPKAPLKAIQNRVNKKR